MNGDHDHEYRGAMEIKPRHMKPRRWVVVWTANNTWAHGAKGRSVIDFHERDAKRICRNLNRSEDNEDFKYSIEPATKG